MKKEMTDQLQEQVVQLKRDVASIKADMAMTKHDMATTKHDIKMIAEKMDTGFGLMLNRFDTYGGNQKIMDQEQLVQGLHIKELRETTLEHENRIAALEASRPR